MVFRVFPSLNWSEYHVTVQYFLCEREMDALFSRCFLSSLWLLCIIFLFLYSQLMICTLVNYLWLELLRWEFSLFIGGNLKFMQQIKRIHNRTQWVNLSYVSLLNLRSHTLKTMFNDWLNLNLFCKEYQSINVIPSDCKLNWFNSILFLALLFWKWHRPIALYIWFDDTRFKSKNSQIKCTTTMEMDAVLFSFYFFLLHL